MSDKIVLQWDGEIEPYTQPVKIYWNEPEEDGYVEVSEVEFFIHKSLLMMRSRYSSLQGILESNWCLGYYNKPEDCYNYAEFVFNTFKQHSNLKECPAVVYVEWEGQDAYDLSGELITKEYFIR